MHWNPAGATLDEAWAALGLSGGLLAVIGGTEPFGLFLDIGYDVFHLSRASQGAACPAAGRCSPASRRSRPEQLLARHGLKPGPTRVLDEKAGLIAGDLAPLDRRRCRIIHRRG